MAMKISELQVWLEQQKVAHGDIFVLCSTAFGNVAEQDLLTPERLGVSTAERLCVSEFTPETKLVAIGLEPYEL
ncbi:hypothetical protein [Pseudomonas lini]|jgi:hypothetical protein|uniref:hypothetical protein n=1 Tax=Pseudomonas lini TaxID=163011 RepID=UPI000681037B|nr:hypothetical protein [Pseudomonas lini]KNH43914.1 hypothetical protein ACS73_23540 [Pseudomonas lini]